MYVYLGLDDVVNTTTKISIIKICYDESLVRYTKFWTKNPRINSRKALTNDNLRRSIVRVTNANKLDECTGCINSVQKGDGVRRERNRDERKGMTS